MHIADSPNTHSTTSDLNQILEEGGNISDSPVSHDKITDTDDTSKGNLNHQRFSSQEVNIEKDVPSLFRKEKKPSIACLESLLTNSDALCSKVLVILGVCCITGCFLLPIIFFGVNQARGNTETIPVFSQSHKKNTSNAKVIN